MYLFKYGVKDVMSGRTKPRMPGNAMYMRGYNQARRAISGLTLVTAND